MSAFIFGESPTVENVEFLSSKSYFESDECVFKKCCEKYKKKKGEHCKKCPKK